MPTVPTFFAPEAAQQPTPPPRQAATPVQPMENHAPTLEQQIGAAVEGGGVNLMREGQDLRANLTTLMNDSAVRTAETQFLTSATKIATEYTHTLGQDAIQGYDGAAAALAKAKQDAQASLSNPAQLRNFGFVADQHLARFGTELNDHKFQQTVKYGADASDLRSESMIQQAAGSYADWQRPDGKYATFKHQAVTEALHGAALLGLPPDSPQAQQLVKEKTTELARGVLTRMMDGEQYDEAKTYYDKALAAGEIDEKTAETLGNAIMEGHNSQKGKNAAEQAKQQALGAADASQPRVPLILGAAVAPRLTDTMGSPRPGGRVHDGLDFAIPMRTQLQAPADGTITKVWNDDKFGGGLSMEITYPNGNVEGVAHLSAVNYQPGQKVTQGSIIALSGASGNATGPSVHWSMRDKDGNWIDPRTASPAPKNPADFTDPDMLEKAIAGVNARTDLTQRVKDTAINQLKSDYTTQREIQNQQYQKVKGRAVDYYYQHNGSIDGLPAAVKMQLKPEDLYSLSKPPATEDDISTRVGFILNPETVQVQNVQAAYAAGKLSNGSYLSLLKDAQENAAKPAKVQEASADADRVKYLADQAGLNVYGQVRKQDGTVVPIKKTPADEAEFGALVFRIQQDINQLQQKKNGKATQDEKDALIARELTQHTLAQQGMAWYNPARLLFPGQIFSPLPGPTTKWFDYQAPRQATHVVRGDDGKMHYTDGQNDLGVVQ